MSDRRPKKGRRFTAASRHVVKDKLVRVLRSHGCIATACKGAGTTYRTYYDWLEKDAEFAEAVADAKRMVGERLEIEAHRRGVLGVPRAVYHQGKVVGYEREYSDTLLRTLLAANLPEKYGKQARDNYNTQINIGARGGDAADGETPISPQRQAMLDRLRAIILGAYPEARQLENAAHEAKPVKSLPVIDGAGNGPGHRS